MDYSIIIETHNLEEGTPADIFYASLKSALSMISDGQGEIIIIDVLQMDEIKQKLSQEFPFIRVLPLNDTGYDRAKMIAAKEAKGNYVLFLDSDCIPSPGWHYHLLECLKSGKTACAGYTTYQEEGLLGKIMTVMDMGCLFPLVPHIVRSYALNNAGFVRKVLLEHPVPDSDMRCNSYGHAQLLLRNHIPVWFVPDAHVVHDMPSIIKERTRRGYDVIAACWADPNLFEARWLSLGIFSVPLFYSVEIFYDVKRTFQARNHLRLDFWQAILMLSLFPLFRLLDAIGMFRAFMKGPSKGGWGGF
jgi:glycosyltransferase involved in cell wall biosynthesis